MSIESITREFNTISADVKPVADKCDAIRNNEKYGKLSNLELLGSKGEELSAEIMPILMPTLKNNIGKIDKVVNDLNSLIKTNEKYQNDPTIQGLIKSINASLKKVISKLSDLNKITPRGKDKEVKEYIAKFENIKDKIS